MGPKGLHDFEGMLTFYYSYHMDQLNQVIHMVFIPAILWTALIWLCYTPPLLESPADLEINGHPLVSLNGAFVVIVSYCMYYIYLDRPFGLAWTVIAAPTLYLFANAFFAAVGRELAWKYAVAIHISSWAAQGIGQGLFEKRAPELLQSIVQSFLVAPLFAFMEIAFAGGYRRSLQKRVHARAMRERGILNGRLSPKSSPPASPARTRRR
uniref:DUF962 domain-containing protein n=1 Tax=Prasinoderma coloniale TaxID=156133 RepID=A0A6U0P0Q9_9VIRI|eukprot:PRCOL_00000125-RA